MGVFFPEGDLSVKIGSPLYALIKAGKY